MVKHDAGQVVMLRLTEEVKDDREHAYIFFPESAMLIRI